MGDKVLFGLVLPTIFIIILTAAPYIDYNLSRRGKDRRLALAVGFFVAAAMVVLSFYGIVSMCRIIAASRGSRAGIYA